jgi:hypothetical protein
MFATLLALFSKYIVPAIMTWVALEVRLFLERISAKKAIEKKADESVQQLKEAKTGEEIDKASDKALGGF